MSRPCCVGGWRTVADDGMLVPDKKGSAGMRIGLGYGIALSLVGSGCAAGPAPSSIGTAIYVPPVRLGGTGSVMFLPAPRPTRTLDSDEAVVRAALADVAAPDQCVDPVVDGDPLRWWADMLTNANHPAGSREAAERIARIKAGMGLWYNEAGGEVDPATAARLAEAIDAIVAAMPRRPSPAAALPPDWLAPGQRIGRNGDCSKVVLSRPVRRGMLSFIGIGITRGPLNGSCFVLAMDRSGGAWRAIARQRTWVS